MKIKIKDVMNLRDMVVGIILFALPMGLICGAVVLWAYRWLSTLPLMGIMCLCFAVVCLYAARATIVLAVLQMLGDLCLLETEKEAVPANHGNQLLEVMDAIRHEKYEYNSYFDLAGNKLAEGTLLSPNMCTITTEDWDKLYSRGKDAIGVHNHPNNFDGTFSAQDIEAFLSTGFSQKEIVVTKHYDYILEKVARDYEHTAGDVITCFKRVGYRYAWISFFSMHLWSVATTRQVAKRFNLKFGAERIRHTPAKRHVLGLKIPHPQTY